MSQKDIRRKVITIAFVSIFLVGFIPRAVMAGEAYSSYHEDAIVADPERKYRVPNVYIFYASDSGLMEDVAFSVKQAATTHLDGVRLIPISSLQELDYWMNDEPWIAIYSFDSNLTHVNVGDDSVTWSQFYRFNEEHKETNHVLGMANTLSFQKFVQDDDVNIFHSQAEQTDALLLVLYDLWTLSDLLDTKAEESRTCLLAATELKRIGVQLFSENFNEMLQRNIEPVDTVGQIDPVALEERTKQMWEDHAAEIRPASYHKEEDGSLTEIPEDEIPEDFSPVIMLTSPAMLADDPDAMQIGEVPVKSGLRGPIGEIIDVLLDILVSSDNKAISIAGEVMQVIKEIFVAIQPFLGVASDFSLDSPLKAVVEVLANEFPFIEEYKGYLNILLKALFNLRGDVNSIIGVVTEAVVSLLPEIFPGAISDFVVDLLGVGSGLADVIADVAEGGDAVFDTLLGYFTNNVLSSVLNKTLVATFNLNPAQVDTLLPRLKAFTLGVIDYLSTRDFNKLITEVGDDLLVAGLGLLTTDTEEVIPKTMAILKLAFTVLNVINDFDAESVTDMVSAMLSTIIGDAQIIGTSKDLAQDALRVVKTYKEEEYSSTTDFATAMLGVLNESLSASVSSALRDVIVDAMMMITGFYNAGFDPAEVPDVFDVIDGLITELLHGAEATNVMAAFNDAIKPMIGILGIITDYDPLKKVVSRTLSDFDSEIGSIPTLFVRVVDYLDLENVLDGISGADDVLSTLGTIASGIIKVVGAAQGKSFQGVMQSLLISVGSITAIFPAFDDVPLDAFLSLLQAFFPDLFDIPRDERPRRGEVIAEVMSLAESYLGTDFDSDMLSEFLGVIMDTKDIFTNGVQWLVGKLFDWLTGELTPLLKQLEDGVNNALSDTGDLVGYHSTIPIGVGDWNLFDLTIDLGIVAGFSIDPTPLFDLISSVIFEGRKVFEMDTLEDFFVVVFKCFEISPQFYARLGVNEFDTSKNPLLKFLLVQFGLELTFSGSAYFILNLFTFRAGIFQFEDFFKIVEWGLNIRIGVSRVFTILDFVSGGAAGGLNAVAEYIGLDSITITVLFAVELDIVKRAATALNPEVSTLSISIILGAVLHIGIDLYIISLSFDGSLEIILTFFQDLASSDPMIITLALIFTIKVNIDLGLFDKDFEFSWQPSGSPWDLSPHKGEDEYEESGIGFDSDGDGLSDTYEATIPGLNPNEPDTDFDGASDKLEVQTMFTDATDPDCDLDGLLDGEEWEMGTSPIFEDTDWDYLTDFEEVYIYGTDPLCQDTDGDGLTDEYEIFTPINITTVTPTVTEVIIGGESYNDRTDPLNPDTDGDGLLDGDEGPMAAYYGLDLLYNDTAGSGFDADPIIFNFGYTHPLDADTDDDSYYQLYNGVKDSQAPEFLYDMNDGAEVRGIDMVFIDDDGFPYNKRVFTNPCNPDSDGDTGVTDRTPQAGLWLNSDGYELAQSPPTDPNNADSDGDGLIDGIEGVLNPYSNHTNPNIADTDGDGLYDMQELLLGCDPRSVDSDGDLITDGDEFYVYNTNPRLEDSDFDALKDGEEVFLWHSNPLLDDSDGDRLFDGEEVLRWGSDPMDEDSDNDGLTDFQEVKVYYTSPFDWDTDYDGLSDGQEALIYKTDPLNWDTDRDSILEPNEDGDYTWPMSDYDEVTLYDTNATATDTDHDGLSDAIELYLGSGLIPWMDALPLDATNADTDGDMLSDGSELMLVNVSDIVYPYLSITIEFKYNSSPCAFDTDGDLLSDYQEAIIFNTDPGNVDTDNDTLDDWHEIWVYNSSALSNDTDGDGLYDFEETLYDVYPYGSWPPTNWSIGLETSGMALAEAQPVDNRFFLAQTPIYPTSATEWDSDGDWLPDSAEMFDYFSDPMVVDSNSDGVNDTYDFDTDHDGLEDGMEYKLGLCSVIGGGIYHQDSDGDGLLDGAEVYTYGTNPLNRDSDGDGLSDGFEIATGTNPLGMTYFSILSPVSKGAVGTDFGIAVMNYTNIQSMHYRLYNGATYGENTSLTYDAEIEAWLSSTLSAKSGLYTVQVFGNDINGTEYMEQVTFAVVSIAPEPNPVTRAMVILTPVSDADAYSTTAVRVVNLTSFESMWYNYEVDGVTSNDTSLVYDSAVQEWYNDTILWEPGEYTLNVYGSTSDGDMYSASIEFRVPPISPGIDWLLIISIIAVCAAAVVIFGLSWHKGYLQKILPGSRNSTTPGDAKPAAVSEPEPEPVRKKTRKPKSTVEKDPDTKEEKSTKKKATRKTTRKSPTKKTKEGGS